MKHLGGWRLKSIQFKHGVSSTVENAAHLQGFGCFGRLLEPGIPGTRDGCQQSRD